MGLGPVPSDPLLALLLLGLAPRRLTPVGCLLSSSRASGVQLSWSMGSLVGNWKMERRVNPGPFLFLSQHGPSSVYLFHHRDAPQSKFPLDGLGPYLLQITYWVYSSVLGQMVVSCPLQSLIASYLLLSHILCSNTLTTWCEEPTRW